VLAFRDNGTSSGTYCDVSLVCSVCEIVLLTLFSMTDSPGLHCTELEEASRTFGLILNSVLGGPYYDETRQPDLHLKSCFKLSPYSTVNTLCLLLQIPPG